MKLFLLLIIFLFIGAFFIISQNNLALVEKQNFLEFITIYKSWVYNTMTNLGSATGYIVKMEWLPN